MSEFGGSKTYMPTMIVESIACVLWVRSDRCLFRQAGDWRHGVGWVWQYPHRNKKKDRPTDRGFYT